MPSMVFTKFGTSVKKGDGWEETEKLDEIEGQDRDTQLGTEQHYRSFFILILWLGALYLVKNG